MFGALINQTFAVLWKILFLTHSVTVGLCSESIFIFVQKKAEAAQARLAKLGVPLPGGKVFFSKQLQLSAGTGTWFIFACCITSRLQSKSKRSLRFTVHTLKRCFDFRIVMVEMKLSSKGKCKWGKAVRPNKVPPAEVQTTYRLKIIPRAQNIIKKCLYFSPHKMKIQRELRDVVYASIFNDLSCICDKRKDTCSHSIKVWSDKYSFHGSHKWK